MRRIKLNLSVIVYALGIIEGYYISLYLLLYKSIESTMFSLKYGTLTFGLLLSNIINILLAFPVGNLIIYCSAFLSYAIATFKFPTKQ